MLALQHLIAEELENTLSDYEKRSARTNLFPGEIRPGCALATVWRADVLTFAPSPQRLELPQRLRKREVKVTVPVGFYIRNA